MIKKISKSSKTKNKSTQDKNKLSPKPKSLKSPATQKTNKNINKTTELKKTISKNPPEKPEIIEEQTIVKSDEKKIIKKDRETKSIGFKIGDYAFYPSHGVGKILEIETIEIDNKKLNILVVYLEKERLTIKIPADQISKTGLRPLISKSEMEEVFDILRSGVKKLKGMWSRRAQEYEAKINSGNIILLAEVLRDLTRDIEDGDRSYSERIIYETAINRLAAEFSVISNISFEEAKEKIISTAKQKLGNGEETKSIRMKDNFDDDFDVDEESEEEDEDDDEDEDDEDDEDAPKKRGRKKKK